MVTSVASNPYYSYLSRLTGASSSSQAASSAAGANTASPATSPAGGTSQSSQVSSLLGGGANSYSSEVLSLLQGGSSGSFNPVTTLLGGASTDNPLTSLYADLYAGSAAATLTAAQDNAGGDTAAISPAATASSGSGASTGANPIDSLIAAATQASVAYNQTLQQNAASVLAANSYGPDGVTPLSA